MSKSGEQMKPLTAEEIAELRMVCGLPGRGYALTARLLDEVERYRGTDHPEREPTNMGATAIDTLNRAPFTPGGRFLYPRAYNQIHAELERSRALLKRIEWSGDRWGIDSNDRGCPVCKGSMLTGGHAVNCELAALL